MKPGAAQMDDRSSKTPSNEGKFLDDKDPSYGRPPFDPDAGLSAEEKARAV